MAFRKRNTPLGRTPTPREDPSPSHSQSENQPHQSSRQPTPQQSRPQTHPTGTTSLDTLLSLLPSYTTTSGPGLALGTSLLVEESGITDYSGVIARCYAAEGVVRADVCHVVGVGRGWVGSLPGFVGAGGGEGDERKKGGRAQGEGGGKMKIAWRYEGLERAGGMSAPAAARERPPPHTTAQDEPSPSSRRGSHTFDLTKRLTLPANAQIHHHTVPTQSRTSPFAALLTTLTHNLTQTPQTTTHRLIIPSLLSPAIPYPPHACIPSHVLSFLHALRALLRRFANRLTAIITLPLDLHPRTSALTRAIEHLTDGVLELAPFPHRLSADAPVSDPGASSSSGKKGAEEEPQGLIRVHKLPVLEERGMGGQGMGNDMAFVVSRRRFEMREYSLPPEVGDGEAQGGGGGEGTKGLPEKRDIEF